MDEVQKNLIVQKWLERKYSLFLLQPNEKEVGEIQNYLGLSYSPGFGQIGELSFRLDKYTVSETGEKVENYIYKFLKGDTLVVLNDTEYFYVDSCDETVSEIEAYKEVHAYSREYEMSHKKIVQYQSIEGGPHPSRFLYYIKDSYPWTSSDSERPDFPTQERGVYRGVFNQIELLTNWKLKRVGNVPVIPESLRKEARALEMSNGSLLEFLSKIQEAFNCVFKYDTKKQEIEILSMEDLVQKPTFLLSNKNFITNLKKELKTDQIVTRLYVYGPEGRGINRKMAHAQSYVEDYSYFKKPEFMSANLISALTLYEDHLEMHEDIYAADWLNYDILLEEQTETRMLIAEFKEEIAPFIRTIEVLEAKRDGYTDEQGNTVPGTTLTQTEKDRLANAKTQYNRLFPQITRLETGIKNTYPRSLRVIREEIDKILTRLDSQTSTFLMENIFGNYESLNNIASGTLMKEMNLFVKEDVYNKEYFFSLDDLFQEGKAIISVVSKPPTQFSISIEDFLEVVEDADILSFLRLGSVLEIEQTDLGIVAPIRLLKYTHAPDDFSLSLEFSDRLGFTDSTSYLADLISRSNSIGSKVDFNSAMWASGGAGSAVQIDFENAYFKNITANLITVAQLDAQLANIGELIADRADINFANITEAAINNLITQTAFISTLLAEEAFISTLSANEAFIESLVVSQAFINNLEANYATIAFLEANYLTANSISTEYLKADFANIDFGLFETILADLVLAENVFTTNLSAKYADIDLLQVSQGRFDSIVADAITTGTLTTDSFYAKFASADLGSIETLFSTYLTANEGFIEDLVVMDANIVELNASKIKTGTLSAERILLTGSDPNNPNAQPLLLTLNNLGELVSQNVDTLDGYILTNNSIHADKIIAESITAREIAAGSITAQKLLAGTITAESGIIGSIDASKITTGTLDAARIKTGLLSSLNEQNPFFLNLETGYFNLGNVLIYDQLGVRLIAGGKPVEEYIEEQVARLYEIEPSVYSLVKRKDGTYSLENISFSSYYRLASSTSRTSQVAYWKVEYLQGATWSTLTTHTGNLIANYSLNTSTLPENTLALKVSCAADIGFLEVYATQGIGIVADGLDGLDGAQGPVGDKGDDGRGIVSTVVHYQASSSGTTTPTGTWTTSIPSVADNQFLWTRTTITYTSGSPSVAYSIGKMGAQGPVGSPGSPGTPAKVANIVASSTIFKSNDGGATFSPDSIVLTPVFQGVSYDKWQFSANGLDWTNITSQNGLSIHPTTRVLTIPKTSSLFTTLQTSINFKLISTDSTIQDTITISKVYDVVDLGQEAIFNRLTNNNENQGIFLNDGKVYINGEYIRAANIVGGNALFQNGYINTAVIEDATITSAKIQSLDAGKINANSLDAISANLGTVTAGRIQNNNNTSHWDLTAGTFKLGSALDFNGSTLSITANSIKIGFTNVATESDVSDAVNDIRLGGRNLLRFSGEIVSNTNYAVVDYPLTQELQAGETVTFRMKATLGGNKTSFVLYNSGGTGASQTLINHGDGTFSKTFNWSVVNSNDFVRIYAFTLAQSGESTIEWAKLERGNKPTDWSPAPEDVNQAIGDTSDYISESIGAVEATLSELSTNIVRTTDLGELLESIQEYQNIVDTEKEKSNAIAGNVSNLLARTNGIEAHLQDLTQRWFFLDTYMVAGNEGLLIGDQKGGSGILIGTNRIDFLDGAGEPVAYISDQVMRINRGIFVDSLQVGEHKVETLANGITVWTWV